MKEHELIEHIVIIDDYMKVTIGIPKELTALELTALMTKAKKLFNVSDSNSFAPIDLGKRNMNNWSQDETNLLKDIITKKTKMTIEEFAEDTGRSVKAVKQRASKLNRDWL